MKLSECTYGTIVTTTDEDQIGMVVGITNNCSNADQRVRQEVERAIPLVQWAYGETCGIHHRNLKKYKG